MSRSAPCTALACKKYAPQSALTLCYRSLPECIQTACMTQSIQDTLLYTGVPLWQRMHVRCKFGLCCCSSNFLLWDLSYGHADILLQVGVIILQGNTCKHAGQLTLC